MITAIVLAAGEARRFGSCKQLAPVDGKPMLQHVLDNLAQSKLHEVLVILGSHADEIRSQVRFGSARVIMNPDHADGMSTSIQAGLRAINSDTAMMVLGDQPFVSPRTVDALIDEYHRTHAAAVIPTFGGVRGNPIIVDRSLFAEMMEVRGDVGFRSIFGTHEVTEIAVDDPGVLMDIDTPAQC